MSERDCKHPPSKLYCWFGRDDRAPGSRLEPPGHVLIVACTACGAVLRGAAGSMPWEQEQTTVKQ